MLEITAPRVPCCATRYLRPRDQAGNLRQKVKALDPSSPRWGMSGFYASVLAPGRCGPGDPIEVLAKLA